MAKEKKLNKEMTEDEFGKFQIALEKGDKYISDYITQYITENTKYELSRDDVLSLALIWAEHFTLHEVVEKILSIPHNSNILATVSEGGDCPTSQLFCYRTTPEVMGVIENYLEDNEINFELVDLSGNTFLFLHSSMYGASFEDYNTTPDNAKYCREHFLQYIYTEKSLDQFESAFEHNFDVVAYRTLGHDAYFATLENVNKQLPSDDLTSGEESSLDKSIKSESSDSVQEQSGSRTHSEESKKTERLSDSDSNEIPTPPADNTSDSSKHCENAKDTSMATTASQRGIGPMTNNYLASQDEKKKPLETSINDRDHNKYNNQDISQKVDDDMFDSVYDQSSWIKNLPKATQASFSNLLKSLKGQRELAKAVYDKLYMPTKFVTSDKQSNPDNSLNETNFESFYGELFRTLDTAMKNPFDGSVIASSISPGALFLPTILKQSYLVSDMQNAGMYATEAAY